MEDDTASPLATRAEASKHTTQRQQRKKDTDMAHYTADTQLSTSLANTSLQLPRTRRESVAHIGLPSLRCHRL